MLVYQRVISDAEDANFPPGPPPTTKSGCSNHLPVDLPKEMHQKCRVHGVFPWKNSLPTVEPF